MKRIATPLLSLAFWGAMSLAAPAAEIRLPGYPFRALAGIPQAFRITPAKPGYFMMFGLYFNPTSPVTIA